MSRRLLIVEDEEDTRRAVASYFEGLGYRVDAAHDRRAAEDRIDVERFDVLITDLRLAPGPDEGGLEVASRAVAVHAPTRAILLTAYSSAEVCRRARAHGIDLVLDKPTPLGELARAVERLLRPEEG